MSKEYKAIFASALDITLEAKRDAYIRMACDGDKDLLAKVESLLEAHNSAQGFMETREVAGIGPKAGEVIGNYKLREKIGEGGMGMVYIAEQSSPVRRKVALKVIKPGRDTREVVARFQAERQALAMMDHPNIAKVFDGGSTEQGYPYFVMELVRGEPITDYCNTAKLEMEKRLSLFSVVCDAIQHAHLRGIIHRDIKPSNVLVSLHDGNPVVKVIDFGVAKALNHQLSELSVYTRFQQIIGTPLYMSPEQAELSGLDVDTRSDVYSLGVLLYEMLTGVTPFDRRQFREAAYDEMRRIIREEEPIKPSTRISSLTNEEQTRVAKQRGSSPLKLTQQLRGELDWIIGKALEKERTRRYESCRALAQDIECYLKNEPVEAGPPGATYRLRKLIGRHRVAAFAILAIVGALMLGITVASAGWRKAINESRQKDAAVATANEARDEAMHISYLADMQSGLLAMQTGNLASAKSILKRNQSYDAERDPRNWEYRALWQLCQSKAVKAFGNTPVHSMTLSPDQQWVVTNGWEIWNVEQEQLQGEIDGGRAARFSPEGKRLFVRKDDGAISVRNVPEFKEIEDDLLKGMKVVELEISPDGEWLAALVENEDAALFHVDSGRLVRVPVDPLNYDRAHAPSGINIAFSADSSRLAIAIVDVIRVVDIESEEHFDIPRAERLDRIPVGTGSLQFSPDGRFIAVAKGKTDSQIKVFRISDRKMIKTLKGHTKNVTALVYSQDGGLLFSGSGDQTIAIWDTSGFAKFAEDSQEDTNNLRVPAIAILREHELDVNDIERSSDGRRLFSGGKDGRIVVCNLNDLSKWQWPVRGKSIARWGSYCHSAQTSLSRDGTLLATTKHGSDQWGTDQFGFTIRSTTDLGVIREYNDSDAIKTGVRFSPIDDLLVVGGEDGSLEFVSTVRHEVVDRIEIAKDKKVFPIQFSRDGRHLVVLARKEKAPKPNEILYSVLSTTDRRELAKWSETTGSGKYEQNRTAAISPDAQLVVTAGYSKGVHLYHTDNPSQPNVLPIGSSASAQGGCVVSVDFSPDGQYIVAGNDRGRIEIIDVASLQVVGTLSGHRSSVGGIRFSPDGKRVAACGNGKADALKIWDFETRREIITLAVQDEAFFHRQVDWSPDGNSILIMGGDGTVSIWRVPGFNEITARRPTIDG